MKTTKNLGLNMPDKDDFVEIDKINENTEKIDEELAKKADASGGDISETVITTTEESADEYPVPAAGDNAKTVLGKVQKFFGDLRNWMTGVCLLGQIVNNCVTDNAKLPLSAAQGKALMDLYNVLNTNQQNFQNCFFFSDIKNVRFGRNGTDHFWITFVFPDGSADSLEVRKDKNVIRYNRCEKDGDWYTVFEK